MDHSVHVSSEKPLQQMTFVISKTDEQTYHQSFMAIYVRLFN